jgi:hypothetical protein
VRAATPTTPVHSHCYAHSPPLHTFLAAQVASSCGDLIFSSHMTFILTGVFVWVWVCVRVCE